MRRPPTHPSEMFEKEWRKPSGVSHSAVARCPHVSPTPLRGIVAGTHAVTAAIAARIGALTGTTPQL